MSAYVFVFFLPIFAKQQLGIAPADANLATFMGTAVILLICPFAGYLSDCYGRKAVLFPGMLGYGIVAWFSFHHLVAAPSFQSLLAVQVAMSFFMSFIWAPIPIVLTEVCPVGGALNRGGVHIQRGGVALRRAGAIHQYLAGQGDGQQHRAPLLCAVQYPGWRPELNLATAAG
ncbi:MFS transporter [Cupriavidus basilensis]|uniref:MFS transporter n=1 Tax=Cupriavidus basilensis TaxID=68895 RepID=UPI0039F6DE95